MPSVPPQALVAGWGQSNTSRRSLDRPTHNTQHGLGGPGSEQWGQYAPSYRYPDSLRYLTHRSSSMSPERGKCHPNIYATIAVHSGPVHRAHSLLARWSGHNPRLLLRRCVAGASQTAHTPLGLGLSRGQGNAARAFCHFGTSPQASSLCSARPLWLQRRWIRRI